MITAIGCQRLERYLLKRVAVGLPPAAGGAQPPRTPRTLRVPPAEGSR